MPLKLVYVHLINYVFGDFGFPINGYLRDWDIYETNGMPYNM